MEKTNLKGLSLNELQSIVESVGERKYRAQQIYSWIYARSAQSIDDMTDVSKFFRDLLKKKYVLEALPIEDSSVSKVDGTRKFLFRLHDGLKVESVLIPQEASREDARDRLTVCISTQVGCPLDCAFCATGTMGFSRNLSSGEIVDQVLQVQRQSPERITNVVYMGMGEPMLNYDNVMKSVDILTDERSLNIGVRHITISTAGYADKIRQMADEKRKVRLALSLHSLNQAKRMKLMPITKKYGILELLDALAYYGTKTRARVTLEYILFDGFNDTQEDVKRIVRAARKFPCKVNIIPYHSIAFTGPSGFAAGLKPSSPSRMIAFARALRDEQVTVMVRSSAGEDIQAACGQLAISGGGRSIKRTAIPAAHPPRVSPTIAIPTR